MTELDTTSPTVDAIFKSYEIAHNEQERTYLGASIIGEECERKLWYGFRWACEPEKFSGRQLRLFQTGHREEDRMVADLRRAGITVWTVDDLTGKQFAISAVGGHFGGHMDGVLLGVPEAPKTPHVFEAKTHKAASFKKLLLNGVAKSKPMHHAQMQTYMHFEKLTRALYLAHCKDDDALYSERIQYDAVFAARIVAKAERIITSSRAPRKLHEDQSARAAFACGWCDKKDVCHDGAWARRNCRTCIESTPELDGAARWSCAFHGRDLTRDDQVAGCKHHRYLPDLVPGEQIDCNPKARVITYALHDGSTWIDGE